MSMRVEQWFKQQWVRRTPWQILLWPLSLLFRLLTSLRRLAIRAGWRASQRLSVPVIVVGNINVGGSGKTPFVIALVEYLQAAGYTPGVISRGYGGSEVGPFEVGPLSDANQVGDEPVLIAMRTEVPLFIGRDRAAAGLALLASHPNCDVVVSDDGLQHYRLHRDIEIAVIDAQFGVGNGMLLPAGPLREPLSRLREVDAVVLNHSESDRATTSVAWSPPGTMPWEPYSMRLSGQVFRNVKNRDVHALPADLRDSDLHAVAGIGHPARFFRYLSDLGLRFSAHPFPDHHRFSANDLAFGKNAIVLMTEKDAVKCLAFAGDNCWALAVSAEIDGRLGELILAKLRRIYGPKTA